jgi:hypothetical protein
MQNNTYRAHIHSTDRRRLCILTVRAPDLRTAEGYAIAKAALNLKWNPADLVAAQVHQQTPVFA